MRCSGSAITSEVRWLCADDPDGKWQVAIPRVQDVEYELYHWEDYAFILRRDKEKFNSEVLVAPLSNLQAGTVRPCAFSPQAFTRSFSFSRES